MTRPRSDYRKQAIATMAFVLVIYGQHEITSTSAGFATAPRENDVKYIRQRALIPSASKAMTELARISRLPADWNGYGSDGPNATASHLAEQVIIAVESASLPPSRVMPCGDGGITLLFTKADKLVAVDCFNSGEIVACQTSDEVETTVQEFESDEQSIDELVHYVRNFIA